MLCTWKWGLRLCADVSLTLQSAIVDPLPTVLWLNTWSLWLGLPCETQNFASHADHCFMTQFAFSWRCLEPVNFLWGMIARTEI